MAATVSMLLVLAGAGWSCPYRVRLVLCVQSHCRQDVLACLTCNMLALPSSAAGLLRERPGSTGMLVVESVVPGGPADGQLEPGDVLVGGQGRLCGHSSPQTDRQPALLRTNVPTASFGRARSLC